MRTIEVLQATCITGREQPLARLKKMSDSFQDRIVSKVTSWDGVSTGAGRFGSTRFLVGRRELGHLHGGSLLDLPLPPARKRELLEQSKVDQHRYTPPRSGWVSLPIEV